MSDDEENIVLCMRISDYIPSIPGTVEKCHDCGEAVSFTHATRAVVAGKQYICICNQCYLSKRMDPEDKVVMPTRAQIMELIEARRREKGKSDA